MEAKTIFLTDTDDIIIYDSMFHAENYDQYMKNYYPNLEITEYIPFLLTKKDYCILDLSRRHFLGFVYLPQTLSDFQKEFFFTNRDSLRKYSLYLNNYSLQKTISVEELLSVIEQMPVRETKKHEIKNNVTK